MELERYNREASEWFLSSKRLVRKTSDSLRSAISSRSSTSPARLARSGAGVEGARADFFDRFDPHPRLLELTQPHFFVTSPTESELRLCIEQPAAQRARDRISAIAGERAKLSDVQARTRVILAALDAARTVSASSFGRIVAARAGVRVTLFEKGPHGRDKVCGDGLTPRAVAALEDAECIYGECYFEFDAQWEQFQTESDRITARYGQAYDAWQAAMAKALRGAKGVDLPDRPDL